MSPKVLQILLAARALLAAPGGYRKHALASDADGRIVPSTSYAEPRFPGATCFCAVGAIYQSGGNVEVAERVRQLLLPELSRYCYSISLFNDAPSTTQTDVVRLFDVAVARAEKLLAQPRDLG